MGGFFGVASKEDCVFDLFFGTDYHSHLGTRRGGLAVYGENGFDRAIHNIENSPFRTKFEKDINKMTGTMGIGCISDYEPQPLIVRSHHGTYAITTVGKRVDKMIVKKEVAMKCAFGENPKRCYKDKNNYSRMSTASKLREMLLKAREYDRKVLAAGSDESNLPAYDMKLEALRPVLHGELPLKAHAHQANDIFTALRIAQEFNVKITLEHVTEGHLIVDELKDEPVPMAVGPSLTHASKFELRNKTFETPGILANAGCQVSIITDSPVIPQQYLPLCAGLAIKSGMKEWDALKAITINAAKHIGIEDRVGSLEIGKDADILVMEGSCFEVSAQPEIVIIDGKVVA